MKGWNAWSLAFQLSWTMLFSLLLPLLAGVWLDRRLGTSPLFVLVGAGIGILAATLGVARVAIRLFRETADGQESAHQSEARDEEEPD